MNKSELVKWVANKEGVSIKQATASVEVVFAGLIAGIQEDGEVRLPGIGTFLKVLRAARVGVKPTDGTKINIPARWVARWRVSSKIKELLNEGDI